MQPIASEIGGPDYRHDCFRRLSPGQKALLLWLDMNGEWERAGFAGFFGSRWGRHTALTKYAFTLIGFRELAEFVNRSKFDFEQGRDMSDVNLRYYSLRTNQIYPAFEEYIRAHVSEFFLDTKGHPIPATTGAVNLTVGPISHEYKLRLGRIDGQFGNFGPGMKPLTLRWFANGVWTGDEDLFGFDANVTYRRRYDAKNGLATMEEFEYSGQLKKRSVLRARVRAPIIFLERHFARLDILAQVRTLTGDFVLDGDGTVETFYGPTQPATRIEVRKGITYLMACWDKSGKQVVANGNGQLDSFPLPPGFATTATIRNGRPNGLVLYSDIRVPYVDGLPNGNVRLSGRNDSSLELEYVDGIFVPESVRYRDH